MAFDSSGIERGADGIARYSDRPPSLVAMLRATVDRVGDREAVVERHDLGDRGEGGEGRGGHCPHSVAVPGPLGNAGGPVCGGAVTRPMARLQ